MGRNFNPLKSAGYGMVLAKRNYSKRWVHSWIRQGRPTTRCLRWQDLKLSRLLKEISQIIQCNQEQSSHGFQEEQWTSKAAILHHRRNIHQITIDHTEINNIQSVNLNDFICHQASPKSKNKFHTCIKHFPMG